MVCFRNDETLPLASTGAGRSGTNVIGGDIANDNQIIDPAAAATLLDANTCIALVVNAAWVIPLGYGLVKLVELAIWE